MKIDWFGESSLSAKARDLVDFDMASIRQTVSAIHGREPELWVVSTGAYESGGRIQRDSESPRLVAYAANDHMLYATDGCNACSRTVDLAVAGQSDESLHACATQSGVPLPLLERLIALTRA